MNEPELPPDLDTNARTIPHDLERLRPATAYIMAPADRVEKAEAVVRALLEHGFERSDLVLVSNRVSTLRPYEDQDSIEVANSLHVAKKSGRVGGSVTGMLFGALVGVYAASATSGTTLGYIAGVAIGGLVGATLGAVTGHFVTKALRRRPDELYDELLRDDQILVGVGMGEGHGTSTSDAAYRVLKQAGLRPRRFRGEDAAPSGQSSARHSPDPGLPKRATP